MVLANRNPARRHLRPGRASNVFAGEAAQFELHLVNRSAMDRYAIGGAPPVGCAGRRQYRPGAQLLARGAARRCW